MHCMLDLSILICRISLYEDMQFSSNGINSIDIPNSIIHIFIVSKTSYTMSEPFSGNIYIAPGTKTNRCPIIARNI